jgi:glycerol-3-phosphate dehydrogenase
VVNQYFRERVTPDELVWSFSGVRALYDDGSKKPEDVTRDYELVLDRKKGLAPLLTVYGGKITTHRKLAEAAMNKLSAFLKGAPPWTAGSTLPGGDFPADGYYALVGETIARWPFLSEPHARRLVRAYGTRVERILGEAQSMEDLGPRLTGDLTGAEVRYLVENEWAETAEDILYRRGKFGLKTTPDQRIAVNEFIASCASPA